MGSFSRDTFDKLEHYVSVRLQQGVPILDADWNEMEDIRKHELQTFLKWFVGNGVPKGSDGFRIIGEGLDDDFTIKGGESEDKPGLCLVEGWEVIVEDDIRYTQQPLFIDGTLADEWGVAPLGSLPQPPLEGSGQDERTDLVYLDVWEREVCAEDDDNLINPAIGVETCVRLKRQWVVRAAEGVAREEDLPQYLDANNIFRPGHVYYPLAALTRTAGQDTINQDDIADLRMTELAVMSYNDVRQITADAFGDSYALAHDGQPKLKVSLKEAINAILRDTFPSTQPQPRTSDSSNNEFHFLLEDSSGALWMFWCSNKHGTQDIWYKRCIDGRWGDEEQLTGVDTASDTRNDYTPFALEDSSGVIWVFWVSYIRGDESDNSTIWYNRCVNGKWEGEMQLPGEGDCPNWNTCALEDNSGIIWVFWESYRNGSDIWCNRFANNTWEGETSLTADGGYNYSPFALKDSSGAVWVFWYSRIDGICSARGKCFVNNMPPVETQLNTNLGQCNKLFALEDRSGVIWVFGESSTDIHSHDIWYNRCVNGNWEGAAQLKTDTVHDYLRFALEDRCGAVWVFWESFKDSDNHVWYNRCVNGTWKGETRLTPGFDNNNSPFAIEDRSGDIQVFWRSFAGNYMSNIWQQILFLQV